MNGPTETWDVLLHSEADTERLGQVLAGALPCPAVVALGGTLGAGKTRLVQAMAAAAGAAREHVVSPTFVLCQQYQGRHPIYHLDAYRIADEDEWFELGVQELMEEVAWVWIEWADRFAELLPDEQLRIDMQVEGPEQRRLRITARGAAYVAALASVREQWARSTE